MSEALSAVTAGGDIAKVGSSVAGAAKGGSSPEDVNIPPFYSQGGITPEQQSLADYGLSEGQVATGSTFGGSGTGMSTMATQAGTGNRMAKAVTEGKLSDTDEDAMYKAYQNDVTAETQSLQNQSTLQNLATTQLTSDITQAGKAATTAANSSDFASGSASINTTGS